jgi:F0F1-type ATP synthase assembly protein I
MNTLYNFLTQTYIAAIPTGMIIGSALALVAGILTLTKGGLIRHFINYGK